MIAALLAAAALAQADPTGAFVSANQAYERGDYAAAAAGYEQLVAGGYGSGGVLYNLGNARLRAGDLGGAIAAYRTAQADEPRDEDLRANLAFARNKVVDAVAPPAPSAFARTLLFWHTRTSVRELAVAAVLLNLALWLSLAVRRLRPGWEPARYGVVAAGIPWLAVMGSLAVRVAWPTTVGVIGVPEAAVYAGTSTDAVVRFRLHEGTEGIVREERGEWTRLRLSDGSDGWLPSADVHRVPIEPQG